MAVRTRLSVEARREQLIALGEELFAARPFDEVSIDEIAARAKISNGLLYHYFGSKRDFYVEVVRAAVQGLRAVTAIPDSVPEPERSVRSLDAYLAYVEAHAPGYLQLMGSGGGADPEVAGIVDALREEFAARILEGLRRTGLEWAAGDAPPLLRGAVRGWVGMVEHASLDWVAHRDVPRAALAELLQAVLVSTVQAALTADAPARD
ncbi:MAG: Transcriptional regulator, TetR family protein [Solirubrobacterales bacterium]|nr:Transcriptional regulator, TetR family protein [Solirubrobacterales bacterium]